jgi:hypothetical protein
VDKGTDILQKIADTGDCELLGENPCSKCPLARLKKRPDGTGWLSCFEAIAAPDFHDVRAKYKRAAEAKLIEMAIESAINNEAEKLDN